MISPLPRRYHPAMRSLKESLRSIIMTALPHLQHFARLMRRECDRLDREGVTPYVVRTGLPFGLGLFIVAFTLAEGRAAWVPLIIMCLLGGIAWGASCWCLWVFGNRWMKRRYPVI